MSSETSPRDALPILSATKAQGWIGSMDMLQWLFDTAKNNEFQGEK
jgi:hypothetical protein